VTTREEAREHLAAHALLSDDLAADFLIQPPCEPNGLVKRYGAIGGRGVCR
jgi:hypothetical protein